MRILFIGAVAFSARALHELLAMQAEVVGVCTLRQAAFNADHADLTPIAEQACIPVCHAPDLHNPEVISWIHERKPDIIFCFGWSRLIRPSLLTLPRLGVIGFHPAALPANRGRHPLIWALVLGLTETASTFFFMDEGADSGDILSQVSVPIVPEDDAGRLYERITEVALEQIRDFVPRLANSSFRRQPQDGRFANVWRKRGAADGQIDWRMAAESIHNLVRGLTRPYVGAHFDHSGEEIKVWRTEVEPNVAMNLEPGKILAVDERGILIKAGIGGIRLLETAPKVALHVGSYL
ncbi:MAG: formyltransferase family protein [Lamprobacter sp.]|uniref:methionyl-tRNA formyltransferase n=1 Tax=Lamprobacter sp. TaxID=3100796 RepID=UPI002B260352|nr:formyltransferase family protein [Lamprobacter sp.]MEA3643246.1 formyltransferase family protein [Lamprobacter sp.]